MVTAYGRRSGLGSSDSGGGGTVEADKITGAGRPYAALERTQSHLDVSTARLAPLLGGASPLDRMDTVVGMNEVKTMLAHVEYGLAA